MILMWCINEDSKPKWCLQTKKIFNMRPCRDRITWLPQVSRPLQVQLSPGCQKSHQTSAKTKNPGSNLQTTDHADCQSRLKPGYSEGNWICTDPLRHRLMNVELHLFLRLTTNRTLKAAPSQHLSASASAKSINMLPRWSKNCQTY